MKNNQIIEVKISDIKIGTRFRKEMGDIEDFAKDIEEVGLLHPIGITPDFQLIIGERRLRAYRDVLGRKTIPARIIDVQSILHCQFAENMMRKDYAVSERVAIVDALRSFKHGGDRRSDQARNCDDETLTVDKAAKRAGLGGKDGFARAKKVIDSGVPELVEAMDGGQFSISAAAKIAELEPEDQRESVRRGKRIVRRDPDDFYPTPSYVIEALLKVEDFGVVVWEPACGDGAISEFLKEAGYDVLSSDLIDRDYGEVEDFLESSRQSESIVTNPPFTLAEKFIKKALAAASNKVAMFLPLTFLEGQRRHQLLSTSPLKIVYVFTNRVSLYKGGDENRGGGRAAFAWFVWEHGYVGAPTLGWITSNRHEAIEGQTHVEECMESLPAALFHLNSQT